MSMEWVLQAIDEVDDAVGAIKHCWLGLAAEMRLLLDVGAAAAGFRAALRAALAARP